MSQFPDDRRYAETHEWCKVADGVATIGITAHAADALTDLVNLEFLREVGEDIAKDDAFGEIDSVKTSEGLISPVSGEVVEINPAFEDENELARINESPFDKGWMIKIKLSDAAEVDALMTAEAYKALVEADSH